MASDAVEQRVSTVRRGGYSAEFWNLVGTIANVSGLAFGLVLMAFDFELEAISIVILVSIALYILFRSVAHRVAQKENRASASQHPLELGNYGGDFDLHMTGDVKLVKKK